MSGKTILFTEGGTGIAAGAPFTTFHYTIVTSVPTPTIANGRLAQLGDAEQSIVAPGVLAGGTTLVLGNAVIDAVGGDRSILIGASITQNSGGALQAERQILIGNVIDMSLLSIGCTQLILIGDNPTFPVTGVQPDKAFSVAIGHNLRLNTPNQFEPYRNNVQIGNGSDLTGSEAVCIGDQSKVLGSQGVAVGKQAQANYYSVAIGYQASSQFSGALGDADVVIGRTANGHPGSVVIGQAAGGGTNGRDCVFLGWEAGNGNNSTNVTDCVLIGRSAGSSASVAIAIGHNAKATLPNTCVIGNDAGFPINALAIGVFAAQSGTGLRVPNLGGVTARNAANLADVSLLSLDVTNRLNFGDYGFIDTAAGLGNTAQGDGALRLNTIGVNNSALGSNVLFANTTGVNNLGIGFASLFANTIGGNNTAIGALALISSITGSQNIALGFSAGRYELGSNAFYINNQDRGNTAGDKAASLLYGTFNANPLLQTLAINATVGLIGANGAAAALAVLTNAPTNNAVQYIPLTFNGASGWVPWIPA